MEFGAVVNRRRTIRDFDAQEIPEEIIAQAIAAAFKAPSYNHLRRWDFLVVTNPDTKMKLTQTEALSEALTPEIIQSFQNHDELAKRMYLEAIPKQKSMILEAPAVIAVMFKPKTWVEQAKQVYDLNCLASIWCAIENLLLALVEQNVFGVTFIPQNTPGVRKVLNIPEEYEVAALIPIGYKKANIQAVQQKVINVSEHIHYERW